MQKKSQFAKVNVRIVLETENQKQNLGTKPVPIERVFNPEHFDMHLETGAPYGSRVIGSMVPMALPILLIKKHRILEP